MNTYDFIIVGAGSAGCALAYRLSENPRHSVLLLEAGRKDDSFMVRMPLGFQPMYGNPKFDWCYRTEPYSQRRETPPVWTRGKMLGGCSSVNGMVYVRGQPEDYDGWNCPGWTWADVLPAYRAMENHELGADALRGTDGPLDVSCIPERIPLCDAYIEAGAQAGLPIREDLNREDQVGIGYYARTISKGRRVSAARAFLDKCRERPNLRIRTHAQVGRVVFEGRRAAGVRCLIDGGWETLHAAREVILSAGTIGSAQILQLSGIGPGRLLAEHGIELLRDAPAVGTNLQEHFNAGCVHSVKTGSLNAELSGARLAGNLMRYLLTGKGPMAMSAALVGAFAKTRPGLPNANAQWHMAPLMLDKPGGEGASGEMSLKLSKIGGLTSFGCVLHPKPNGSIRIASVDPLVAPKIRYDHLVSEEDQRTTIEIVRFTRRIAEQPALKPYILEEVSPGPSMQSDDALLEHAFKTGNLGYHPVGTCRMGQDADAVVDPRLRVRGVEGLRVADASVMPVITSGNTNAPAMMIGYKAGDLILADLAA